jgi:membrane fusion protein
MTHRLLSSVASNNEPPQLFREIAVEASAGTQIGEPLTTHWRGVALFTVLAFVLIAALVAFAATTEYAPVHRVPSYVDPRGGLVRLSAPISGHVRELAVEQGATVRRGALLAVLDSDPLREDGDSEHGALRRRLDDERGTIEREMGAARQEADANQALIDRKLHGLKAEREALSAQIQASDELLASLKTQSEQIAAVAA